MSGVQRPEFGVQRDFWLCLAWLAGASSLVPAASVAAADAFAYDEQAPLDWQVQETRPTERATVHLGSFASPRGGRVPALLVKPAAQGPFAGIVFMHPGGGPRGKDFFLEEALTLTSRGVVSVLIDGPYRRPAGPPLLAFDERDRESWIQAAVDLRRAVDLLTQQTNVDNHRLGYVGFSYGATLGGVLSGTEPRLRHYVLMAGGPRLTDWLGTQKGPGPDRLKRQGRWEGYLEGMQLFDAERHVPSSLHAAMLLQNGTRDGPQENALRYLDVIAANPRTLRFFDAGHDPGPEALKDRRAWLTRQLGLSPADEPGAVAESSAGYVNGIFYETAGTGEPVVFLHGGQLDRRLWDEQFPLFAREHHVIRYDARGFGKSTSPTNAFTHEDDLHTLLDHLRIRRARLVGLSLGGRTALKYVVRHPERVSALALVAPGLDGHIFRDPAGRTLSRISQAARTGDTNAVVEMWLSNPYMAPAMEVESLRPRLRQLAAENARGWLNGAHERAPELSPDRLLSQIQTPTLLMIGDRDVSDIRDIVARLQQEVPGAQTETFKGAGHMLNLERPAEFTAALRHFLNALPGSKPASQQ